MKIHSGHSCLWAFRPFLVTVGASAVLLAWDYHVRNHGTTVVTAEVLLEGRPVVSVLGADYSISVGGRKLRNVGTPVGIGWKRLTISAPNADPIERGCFVWYGGKDLGTIELQRSRGRIQLEVMPPAPKYTLQGELGNFSSPVGFFPGIPAGEYSASSLYNEVLSPTHKVRVIGNQTTTIRINNPVGGIEIVSDREAPEFILEALVGNARWTGKLPFAQPYLRAGEYRLRARLGEYRIDRTVKVLPGETNRTVLEFVHGGVSITSEPAGATVTVDQVEKGTTPVVVGEIIPGERRVTLTKEGYDPVSVVVTVQGTNVATLNRTLVNTRYRVAMAEATEARSLRRYRAALKALNVALEAQPSDPAALAILSPTQAAAHREECAEWLERGDATKGELALNLAASIEPNAPEIQVFRSRIEKLKERQEEERLAEAKRQTRQVAERALQTARNLIRSDQFAGAQAAIQEARSLLPDDPGLPGVERELKEAQAAAETRRLENQIRMRRRELDNAMDELARADENIPSARLAWKTTKSPEEVKRACEPKDNKGLKMVEVVPRSKYLLTWRSGAFIPLLGGTYIRFAVAELAPQQTEIRANLYRKSVSGLVGTPASQASEDPDAAAIRSLETSLRTALGGDLSKIVP